MDEMEKLLAQLKAEYEQNQKKQPTPPATPPSNESKRSQSTSPLDNLLAEVKAELEASKSHTLPPPPPSVPKPAIEPDPLLLKDVRAEYREKEREERERQQQELLEQQRLEKERQQRKRQAIRQQAQAWLKNLNPRSEEGRWFEEFSYSYEDKLEAAIHYLEAIRESDR